MRGFETRDKGTGVPLSHNWRNRKQAKHHYSNMIRKEEIEKAVSDYLTKEGLFMVDIGISGDNDITITVESEQGTVSIDHCVDITRIVEETFDRNQEDYSLTVTSAGLDQPFKVPGQYRKFVGKEVEVVLKEGGKIKGILSGADEEKIEIVSSKMTKEEGKKKKVLVETHTEYSYGSLKSCKPVIKFK